MTPIMKRNRSSEDLDLRPSVFSREKPGTKPMVFDSAQSGNFRYKSKEDISEYLNSKFPDDMIKIQPEKLSEIKKSMENPKENKSLKPP